MAAVTICSDFGAHQNLLLFPLFPHLFAMKWWDHMPKSSFSRCWILSQLFHSPLSLSSRGSLILLCFLPWEWCDISAYLRFLISLLAVLIPACASSSPAFGLQIGMADLKKKVATSVFPCSGYEGGQVLVIFEWNISWWPRYTELPEIPIIEPKIQKKAKSDFSKFWFWVYACLGSV